MSEGMLRLKKSEEGSQSLLTGHISDESCSSSEIHSPAEGETAVNGIFEETRQGNTRMRLKPFVDADGGIQILSIRVNPSDNSITTLEILLQQSGVDTKPFFSKFLQNVGNDDTTVLVKLLKATSVHYEDVVEDFISEVAMYRSTLQFFQRVLPQSEVLGLFPKCFYVSENAIILQELGSTGFQRASASPGLNVDYDTLILALKTLGRFHALSLFAKKAEPAGFRRHIIRRLKRQSHVNKSKEKLKDYAISYFSALSTAATEPVERLNSDSQQNDSFLNVGRLQQLLQDIPCLIRQLLTPREPLAVVCHGQYDPVKLYIRDEDVKLVDFQMVHYGSPAIDLTSLLFLNGGQFEDWDVLLRVYHDALAGSLDHVEVPGLEKIQQEFIKIAPYGYIVAAGIIRSRKELAEDTPRLASLARRLLHYVSLDQDSTKL